MAEVNTRALDEASSLRRLIDVEPDDAQDLAFGVTRAVYVGVAGSISVVDAHGNVVSLMSGSAQYHPIRVRRIRATGTTAGGVVAMY